MAASSTQPTYLSLVCRIHPVVLFSVVDSYERRHPNVKRVIGVLLGTIDKGVLDVTNCFAVPHNESEDEVAIDIEYVRNMFDLHKRVNAEEIILGWYSTGTEVTAHSVLIHEYFGRECKNPIHVTMDTSLKTGHFGVKAYVSLQIGIPKKTTGTMFNPIPVELGSCYQERVGVDALLMGTSETMRSVPLNMDLSHIQKTCTELYDMLCRLTEYVDDVLAGKKQPNVTLGRQLLDALQNVPNFGPATIEGLLNKAMKDMLMMHYLSDMIKSQMEIQECINLPPEEEVTESEYNLGLSYGV